MIRAIATAALSAVVLAAPVSGEMVTVSGYIGSRKLEIQAHSIANSQSFALSGRPDYLAVTEVYPDRPAPVNYEYTVATDGLKPYLRSFRSVGYGRLTYFVRLPGRAVKSATIKNHNPARPVLIASVTGVSKTELESALKQDRFSIMGLIPWQSKEERGKLAAMLADGIKPPSELGIGVGFSSEIRYANRDVKAVEAEIADCAEMARRHGLTALVGMVSWWSGTPVYVDDGAGGKFGDIKYQQVCYAPDSISPANDELRKLLGDRYDEHYRLSIPNHWSNCPWLTMNSRVLNAYRYRRLDEAVGLLSKALQPDARWLSAVYLENEPRYWDSMCEAEVGEVNPKRLWADFNPYTVEDARKDGVDLDPADGLSEAELAWLHRNVGRYMGATVRAYNRSARTHRIGANLPVYTHSLQHADMFPGAAIRHPASEWGYARGARTGIEGMYTMPSDFYRVREWGRWANLNREENDGMSIDLHLWDLRVAYAMGSDLYNSYNWHAIGPERVFAYVKEFLTEFPVVKLAPASVRSLDKYAFKMKAPMKLQAFSRIELPVRLTGAFKGTVSVGLVYPGGRAISSEYESLDLMPGDHTIGVEFTTPAECSWRDEVLVVLYSFDRSGRMALDRINLNPDASSEIKLILDMRAQRALSLAVIARAEASR